MTPAQLLAACRVPLTVPEQRRGLWEIRRFECPQRFLAALGFLDLAPWTTYTALGRWTAATLHQDLGEIVMEDTPRELRRHLPILLNAHGRVLVSGLGLGCVLRGLLARPEVVHVDVVEIDAAILAMIGPEFERNPRVTLHLGDALTYEWPAGARWDFAWHDVWTEAGSLHGLHAEILARYHDRCGRQGAWQLAREIKRIWPAPLLNAARRRASRAA